MSLSQTLLVPLRHYLCSAERREEAAKFLVCDSSCSRDRSFLPGEKGSNSYNVAALAQQQLSDGHNLHDLHHSSQNFCAGY